MISEGLQSKYCEEDLSKIENFYEAYNDKTQVWDIHHRLETDLHKSKQELIDAGLYYSRPAKELIYLTKKDHKHLHDLDLIKKEEIKTKISKSHKGKTSTFLGKHHSEETKLKMSLAKSGCKSSIKGKKKVWNDESHTKFHYE